MSTARARFTAAVAGGGNFDLAEVALLIAAEEYPGLDPRLYLQRLDELAAAAPAALRQSLPARQQAQLLIDFLAEERGFRGNQEDYYDRRNSFLNDVIERRTGIPITLTLIYMEVARRLGLSVSGVGFPGHFLAVLRGREDVILDPFFARVLDTRACEELLRSVAGEDTQLEAAHLRSVTPRQIVVRILNNLKQIHLRARELAAALACSERILLVDPRQVQELRDRGLLYLELECFAAAQADLERYLELAPDDERLEVIRARLLQARKQAARLH